MVDIKGPNIFSYATKELSQDAVICWLFACLNFGGQYRKTGESFVRFVLKEAVENIEDIHGEDIAAHPCTPHRQYYDMDVYAVIRVGKTLYPIIVEDKTDTYLHGGQLRRYCENVYKWIKTDTNYLNDMRKDFGCDAAEWSEKLIYMYFKTGYPYAWQKDDLHEQVKTAEKELELEISLREVYLDDMVGFLSEQPQVWPLPDYLEHLCGVLTERERLEEQALSDVLPEAEEAYGTEAGCAALLESIFGRAKIKYSHQNKMQADLFWIGDNETVYYSWVFRKCAGAKGRHYAFVLQQYRREKGAGAQAWEDRRKNAEIILDMCIAAHGELKRCGVDARFAASDELGKKQNELPLMWVFIDSSNTPAKVRDYLSYFTPRLLAGAKLLGAQLSN